MVCYRRCQWVRVTLLPQGVGIPVLAHRVRVSQAIALPALADAWLPRVTSPRLPLVAGARLALALTLLALAGALLALARALLPVAMPARVPARTV